MLPSPFYFLVNVMKSNIQVYSLSEDNFKHIICKGILRYSAKSIAILDIEEHQYLISETPDSNSILLRSSFYRPTCIYRYKVSSKRFFGRMKRSRWKEMAELGEIRIHVTDKFLENVRSLKNPNEVISFLDCYNYILKLFENEFKDI